MAARESVTPADETVTVTGPELENSSNSPGTALASQGSVANQPSSAGSPITFRTVHQFDRPLQDEWGIFDPRQAGVEALLRKLLSASNDKDSAASEPAEPEKK